MREELDKKLCEQFPEIFKDRHGNMKETCMCWGFSHGDGWYYIVEKLCKNLENIRKKYDIHVKAVQVKQKNGTLRFYYDPSFGDRWTRKSSICVKIIDFIRNILCSKYIYKINFISKYCLNLSRLSLFLYNREWFLDGKRYVNKRIGNWESSEKMLAHDLYNLIDYYIDVAESMSKITCENCGMSTNNITKQGYIQVICENCQNKENKNENENENERE